MSSSRSGLAAGIRRVIPSISRLTFTPVFKALVNIADVPGRLLVPEFAKLPPNHLRIRVGVGNRLLNNRASYLQLGVYLWLKAFSEYDLKMDSTIIDIGSGCGRFAHILRDAYVNGTLFAGRYVGVDIDEEAIAWCRRNFDHRFTFHVSDHRSASYNRDAGSTAYAIPENDDVADFIFSTSLFTHLLERQAENYLHETARLLRPGGHGHHTFFCVDRPPHTMGRRHHFSHGIGRVFVESLAQPEAAVAYRSEHIVKLAHAAGLVDVGIDYQPGDMQAILRVRKPESPITRESRKSVPAQC